jgi:hypothetical protein
MKINHGDTVYEITRKDDPEEGYTQLDLTSTSKGNEISVGKIRFWDASGQFFIQLTDESILLDVVEEFISVARKAVPIE